GRGRSRSATSRSSPSTASASGTCSRSRCAPRARGSSRKRRRRTEMVAETSQAGLAAGVSLKTLVAHRWARTIVGLVSVLLFLIVWQLVGSNEIVRSDLISYPTEIVQTFYRMAVSGELSVNIAVSLQEFVQGFVPAVVIGVAIGAGFALSRRLRAM